MFKKILFIFIILLCFDFKIDQQIYIKWSKEKKISWMDFQGSAQINTSVAAVSAIGITYNVVSHSIDKYKFEISAVFEKGKSWAWTEKISDTILYHEQGHFDLGEIYARKMRQGLISNQFQFTRKNIIQEIHKVLDLYADSLSIIQNKYDLETGYSRKFEIQDEWNLYIRKELKCLEKYSYRFVDVYLKKKENK